jgi:hypothetical protein
MWKRLSQTSLLVLGLMVAVVPADAAQGTPAVTPSNLDVPDHNALLFTTYATGVQTYVCKARPDDATRFQWTFVAPTADLWNPAGEKVGTHYAGPTWEAADGSKVAAKVVERADAAAPGAIPWLLLEATDRTGSGVFGEVSYIQRLETVGGIAPADGCDQAAAGTERAIEYTAQYAFYHQVRAEQ